MLVGYQTLPACPRPPGRPPRALIAFDVEVLTEAGRQIRYTALATDSCGALLSALDIWGFAKISVAPRRLRR